MKISFKNLGKIKEASLELDDFTLIVGDNSLGKTILLESYALYENVMKDHMSDFTKFKYIHDLKIEWCRETLDNFFEVNSNEPLEFDLNFKIKNNEQLFSEVKRYEKVYLELLKENILGSKESAVEVNIEYKYLEPDKLPRKAKIFWDKDRNILRISYKFGKDVLNIRLPKNRILSFEKLIEMLASRLEQRLNVHYFRHLCSLENILFFPSERNLYQMNAKRKSADFIEDSFSKVDKEIDMRYSESLFVKSYLEYLDFLDLLEDETFDENKNELYQILCKSLGGKPLYEEGVVTKIKSEDEGEINKRLFSTKQTRLLPYFMLCTIMLTQNNRIIIEEPEAHMSLKSMYELVDIMEWIVKKKKLIITSHSDIFVSLLNNLIKQKQIKAKVYELLSENGYSVLKEVIPGDYGYELSFMSEQIIRLNNEIIHTFQDVMREEDRRNKEEQGF